MANNNCDDIFNEIQDLQAQRAALVEADGVLHSAEPPPPDGGDGPKPPEDPGQKWLFESQEGRTIETDFAALKPMVKSLADEDYADLVAGKINARERPLGREGQFTNFAQAVDQMGVSNAQEAGELIMAVTGRWEALKPEDFKAATTVNDANVLAQRIADSFAEAGVRMDLDVLSQGILKNAAPFMGILDKQANLQVFNVVARDNLINSMEAMAKEIEATGVAASPEAMAAFNKAASTAILAERSAAISRRVSGQLLQQLQGDFSQAPALAGKAFKAQLQKEAAELYGKTDLLEDTLAGQVHQAGSLGPDGLDDLKGLRDTVRMEGIDPSRKLDSDWADNWRRQARGFYKDSILFSGNTQFISNYLSNKVAYFMEGYRAGWNNTFSLPNTGTPFLLNLLEKPMQGHKVTFMAKAITDDVVRQATRDALGDAMPTGLWANERAKWQQVIIEGVMKGKNAFSDVKNGVELGEASGLATSVEEQFALANKVLYGDSGKPSKPEDLAGSALTNALNEIKLNPMELPFIVRDRIHLSTRIIGNHFVEGAIKKTTGKDVRLPLTSALQTLAAVDSRTGMRVYATVRANDMLMQTFKDQPDLGKMSWDERRDLVRKQMDEELYAASPTDAQVAAYREQFQVPEDVGNDWVKATIAAKHVGAPVLDTPERLAAFEFSKYARMQTPPKIQLLKDFDAAIQKARQNSYVDAVLPFWRSGASGISYVTENLMPPLVDTAKLFTREGRADHVGMAKTMASWTVWTTWMGAFLGMREGLHAITSTAPGNNKNERDQWKLRNQTNPFFGIPGLGQLPLISVLQTANDIADLVEQGRVSKYDQKELFFGLYQAFTGQLYRAAGFGQFRSINDAVLSQNPKQFLRGIGFMVNGQYNPGSGLFRQLERAGGLGSDARYEPRALTQADRELEQDIYNVPGYDLLQRARDFVHQARQGIIYNTQPLLSNQPLKETDYLGRDLRTPAGWFKREWPTGWPGVYNAAVHDQLLKVGMLKPPAPLMNGRLDGIMMGPELEKEYNAVLGKARGERMSETAGFSGRLNWKGTTSVVEDGEVRTAKRTVHLGEFMDGLTEGRTLYQALNELFKSPTWQRWQQDPRFTLYPPAIKDSRKRAEADAPRAALLQRPGGKVVQLLHDYYGHLAGETVKASTSAPAEHWRQLRQASLVKAGTEDQLDQKASDLESILQLAR